MSAPSNGLGTVGYLHLDEPSGYGTAARRHIDALRAEGVTLESIRLVSHPAGPLGFRIPRPTRTTFDTVVAHTLPEHLPGIRKLWPDTPIVCHTVWETDTLPGHWPGLLHRADAVVVPTCWNESTFAKAGVRVPIVVSPHIARPPPPATSARWQSLGPERLVFYSFGPWTARKAHHLTVEAFVRAFGPDDHVTLVLVSGERNAISGADGFHGSSAAALSAAIGARPSPDIRLVIDSPTDADIDALHRRGDCWLSLPHGEGWGLGPFDAALAGNPVVTTGYGGPADYLAGSDLLVESTPVPVDDPAGGRSYTSDQRWAEPSVDHAIDLLREVARNLPGARSDAQRLRTRLQSTYAPQRVASAFVHDVTTALNRGR